MKANQFKLNVELVPRTCFNINLRSKLAGRKWDIVRRQCYKDANYKCEICGDSGRLEAHEVWHYDDENKVQTLLRLEALCPFCHKTKHAGRTIAIGQEAIIYKQLNKVNGMTVDEAKTYLAEQFDQWAERNKYEWTQDISAVEKYFENVI